MAEPKNWDFLDSKPLITRGDKRKRTSLIVVHCADTYADQKVSAKDIHQWHLRRGWSGIGYHLFIPRHDPIERGRALELQGAHVSGYNSVSVGVCLAGGRGKDGEPENNYTPYQMVMLERILRYLQQQYPDAKIVGHNDLSDIKACPCFDVAEFCKRHNI